MKIAIIGGTGVYDPKILDNVRQQEVETPYGPVSVTSGWYQGTEIAFMPRHGSKHSIPPHLINYRGNIWALKKLGVEQIIATTAVGSLNQNMKPGDFVLVDQFLDFTKGRTSTFYEGGERGVVHVDVTEPYCPDLRQVLFAASNQLGITTHNGGTYVCTEGPRFESPAEIKMFAMLHGDLVGMTNLPESVLAREAEMCYATVSMVTNFAAGISPHSLTHSEVVETMRANGENLRKLIMAAIAVLASGKLTKTCHCHEALREFGGFTL
ncbi:MAG: S-methyl-5'-thioadenosine phosphorylase [Sporomusaceae bacterium]|nr:S-methyl-5'-thioadenosine phosphorylase [Sporomusaceae bacterium]